jgi:hypothetical protein
MKEVKTMKKLSGILGLLLLVSFNGTSFAEDFYLDSPRNKGTLCFEIDNDAIWSDDSQFSNGWSLQYHTVRYASWEETKAPGFAKWVGKHFPTLGDDGSIVRYGQGVGQNMITPGDLSAEEPLEGDLPYAGTWTYTVNWQSFNRRTARNFQISAGVLGEESFAEELQTFVHVDLDLGTDPMGWHTQRADEPILNVGYQYYWRLAHLGEYNNGWAAQIDLGPSAHLGNLYTAVELDLGLRFGWNMLEGFGSTPAPPGRGIFQAAYLPKPSSVSPHAVEVVLGIRGTGLLYSVLYDGSIITDDDREVDRHNFFYAGMLGVNYHYYNFLSIRVAFIETSDVLVEESIPVPPDPNNKTAADNSYGALLIDIYF